MPGLDPGIQIFHVIRLKLDRRVKPGDDGSYRFNAVR